MKPAYVWTLFGVCLSATLLAMGWSSAMVLRLEREQVQTQAQAALEENARLALWRMDSALTALVAQESARPYFQYSAYYSASLPYTNMFAPAQADDALLPSPLLRETPKELVLHFQVGPGGSITSPQVPSGGLRTTALREGHVGRALLAQRTTRLSEIRIATREASFVADVERASRNARSSPSRTARASPPPAFLPADTPAPVPSPFALSLQAQAAEPQSQLMRNVKEFEVRQQSYSQTLKFNSVAPKPQHAQPEQAPPVPVEEGSMAPLWAGDALLLVRRVRVGGVLYVQGCWLDWARLQGDLLSSIQDLLPNARLEPASASAAPGADNERRLAAIPVRLVPGPVTLVPAPASPIRFSLIWAWACLLLAALAVAALLRGVMTLSERRRVFVSAVTHELRTPLTTFRLYTDMLAEGMVVGEEKRAAYLARLRSEAQRLGHLVENVLFYARFESGRAGAVRESVELCETVREIATRLEERARQAGLALVVAERPPGSLQVRVDRSALEQILVNLVDNACKYAGGAATPEIRIQLERADRRASIRVHDHGPGLSPGERRRLFRPFSKSDRDAANSAPGVGLGLALSRRLARAQGGDLRLDTDKMLTGAAFVLTLPLEESS